MVTKKENKFIDWVVIILLSFFHLLIAFVVGFAYAIKEFLQEYYRYCEENITPLFKKEKKEEKENPYLVKKEVDN